MKPPLELSDQHARELLTQLDNDGYFNDENSPLGSYLIEHNRTFVEQRLRDVGYDGPELGHGGHYYPEHGAVYWLFDPSQMDYSDARRLTDKWVASQNR